MAWVHLNDDATLRRRGRGGDARGLQRRHRCVGRRDDASLISVFGDYKHHGDLVEVTGTFNAACPQHGGDVDIHATSLRIVRRDTHGNTDPPFRMIAAAILAGLTLALFLVNLRTDRRFVGGVRDRGRVEFASRAVVFSGVIGIKEIDGGLANGSSKTSGHG